MFKTVLVALLCACPAFAAPPTQTVKIGVLTDMSGPYARQTGQGSVVAAQMAADDCLQAECRGMTIEILAADHQNRPELAITIVRRWFDQDGVQALTDLVNASVQVAISHLVREKDRVALFPGGTTRLTNEDCAPANAVQWMWDTYSVVAGAARPLAKPGAKWFFVTADYVLGQSLQADASGIITAQAGAITGGVRHPFPGTTDFSSYLLQAQSSGADFLGFMNAGSDLQNILKQAREFGVGGSGQKIVAPMLDVTDIEGIGLEATQGTLLSEAFYWDQDEQSRAWTARFRERYALGLPSMVQAGVYSATLHYLKSVAASGSTDAATVIAAMHTLPTHDEVVHNASLRPDGRMVHDLGLYVVKAPSESKAPSDLLRRLTTVLPDQAFRPIAESKCALMP